MNNSARNHTATGIASGASIAPPTPPPPQETGRPGPTYVAHDGHIWRRGMQAWDTLEPANPHVLLASFRQDATNTADWFHPRAAELADELERAMRDLGLIEPQEIAA